MLSSLALLATSLSLYMGPRPEETALFGNWLTGCDNERACAAVALTAPGGEAGAGTDHLEVLVEQPLGFHLDPVVTVRLPISPTGPDALTLHIDKVTVALPAPEAGKFIFRGLQARALVGTMRDANQVELRETGSGKVLARSSLAGLKAALLRIDAQQGKVDTPHALARPGTRRTFDDLPGYSVSLTRPARSGRPPSVPDAGRMASLRAGEACTAETAAPEAAPQMVRLDDDSTLMIMPWACGSGAYNHYANIMIVDGFGEVRPAKFDFDNGITGDGPGNVLVNVGWDDGRRALESHILHRAIGDCGRIDRFIWDGKQFRLSEQRVMPECRGSMERIRVWNVDVVDR